MLESATFLLLGTILHEINVLYHLKGISALMRLSSGPNRVLLVHLLHFSVCSGENE